MSQGFLYKQSNSDIDVFALMSLWRAVISYSQVCATYYTVDHDLLMLHLERQFCLRGVVLRVVSFHCSTWCETPRLRWWHSTLPQVSRAGSDDSCSYTQGVHSWCGYLDEYDRLKLNAKKTELLWAGSKYGSCLTWQQWTLTPAWSRDHQSQWPCAFALN